MNRHKNKTLIDLYNKSAFDTVLFGRNNSMYVPPLKKKRKKKRRVGGGGGVKGLRISHFYWSFLKTIS